MGRFPCCPVKAIRQLSSGWWWGWQSLQSVPEVPGVWKPSPPVPLEQGMVELPVCKQWGTLHWSRLVQTMHLTGGHQASSLPLHAAQHVRLPSHRKVSRSALTHPVSSSGHWGHMANFSWTPYWCSQLVRILSARDLINLKKWLLKRDRVRSRLCSQTLNPRRYISLLIYLYSYVYIWIVQYSKWCEK